MIHLPDGYDTAILMGIQGSGKGTRAEFLRKHGFQHVEMSNVMRPIAREQSQRGEIIRAAVSKGKLAPDEIVMDALRPVIQDAGPDALLLLDGVPRSRAQFCALQELLSQCHRSAIAIHLTLDDEIARQRILERGKITQRADDLDPEAVDNRIRLFHEETEPVIQAYDELGRLIRINTNRSVEEVNREIVSMVIPQMRRQVAELMAG